MNNPKSQNGHLFGSMSRRQIIVASSIGALVLVVALTAIVPPLMAADKKSRQEYAAAVVDFEKTTTLFVIASEPLDVRHRAADGFILVYDLSAHFSAPIKSGEVRRAIGLGDWHRYVVGDTVRGYPLNYVDAKGTPVFLIMRRPPPSRTPCCS